MTERPIHTDHETGICWCGAGPKSSSWEDGAMDYRGGGNDLDLAYIRRTAEAMNDAPVLRILSALTAAEDEVERLRELNDILVNLCANCGGKI